MSEVRPDVDLSALARRAPSPERPPRRRRVGWIVVLLVVLGFAAVLASTVGELFRRTVAVTVVRAQLDSSAERQAGLVVVQAAGWIEPDPFALRVAALVPGVVQEVLVQESQVVELGEVVARMVDDDARLALDARRAELARAAAVAAEATARAAIVEERFGLALAVTARERTARAAVEGGRAAEEAAAQAVVQGEAQVSLADSELVVQRELAQAGASGSRQVEIAEAELQSARGALAGQRAAAAMAGAAARRAEAELARAEVELERRFDDRLELELARAGAQRAEAELLGAQSAVEAAELTLERMAVRAPAAGVVLERLAVPGSHAGTHSGAVAICTMYDPAELRVRVDVPQGEIAALAVGQSAEVLAESRPGQPYAGRVLRIVQRADIQKVTLQAHVRVLDADALLKPEMLVQVRFQAEGGAASGAAEVAVVRIPKRLVSEGAVWIVDPLEGVARRRSVELGPERGADVMVLSGLDGTERLIEGGRDQLSEGTAVRVDRGGGR